MKIRFSLLLFFLSSTCFAQKAVVLLSYNAFSANQDTLQIGDTLSYGSNSKNELISLQKNTYLALMDTENGNILEWKNKEAGSYRIEFDKSNDSTFNKIKRFTVRSFISERASRGRKGKNKYFGMKKTGAVHICGGLDEIDILADIKSTYLRDSTKIFIELLDFELAEDEQFILDSLAIEVKDLRNNIITTQKLDTSYFCFHWDSLPQYKKTITKKIKIQGKRKQQEIEEKVVVSPQSTSVVLYDFSIKTTKGRECKSSTKVIRKPKKPLHSEEEYFKSKETTAIGLFLQFLISCENSDLNIYSYELYQEVLKGLPKEAHSIIPTWREYREYYGIGQPIFYFEPTSKD
ncbi:hypothetical protein [Bernardetia sp.]|uniref:hypothetical protein n=1 Tax=Bernardetia sp. TaxID=1937974 RepID=UPI0025BEA7BA|nr:hypothetical protein [Bernardetia sp.]